MFLRSTFGQVHKDFGKRSTTGIESETLTSLHCLFPASYLMEGITYICRKCLNVSSFHLLFVELAFTRALSITVIKSTHNLLLASECFRALCCKGPPPPRPEYDLVCIGLSGSGKTSLLSQLCSENRENIVSTTGFSIKAVPFQNAILNVKELGGADNIRKYWSRYYQGSQGVIFVLDSASSEDDLEIARNELHSALQHPQLCTLPFLILANHQDKPAARSVQEIKKYLELEPLARGKRWILKPCSLDDMESVKDSFGFLINLLEDRDLEPSRM
ncbi:ADP-ribosylation factor-like protein 15 isoform X2 [Pantherophis guttatus]|uniref:ADP-ribosylation factor-like protein 15 n=2 Tax=Colubroidea TaxID=34989 RepID=A0A6P9DW34_PANGU|nr:ADP-ribosylation factor-like protein 15 isoform X2 [Pantherophis guttatus]